MLAERLIALVKIWDINTYGECLVLQASVPKRPEDLAHSIPIEGTLTGEAVKNRTIKYAKVRNEVLVREGITQMITIPVLNYTTSETVDMVINLYFRRSDSPTLPINEEDAQRLLSRLSTVLQNQVYKRDNEIESKVRNIAASAKGIAPLLDGIGKHLQEVTRCSYAFIFSWNERDQQLTPEGYYPR